MRPARYIVLGVVFLFMFCSSTALSFQSSPEAKIDQVLKEIRAINKEVKDSKEKKSWKDPFIVSAMAIAMGGWVVTLIGLWWTNRNQSRIKTETVIASLESFTGGTQARGIGISIIEFNWDEKPESRKVWVPILHNQALYLLTESRSADKRHEQQNLERIMNLLQTARNESLLKPTQLASLVEAILSNGRPAGVTVEPEKLNEWHKAFS
jgi:hypothetical protein